MKTKKKIFKTKINAADRSQLTGQTVMEVIQDKLNYLVDRVENEPPHILWVSKHAFMWGGGKLFAALDDNNALRKQFLTTFNAKGHLPIKRPTNDELQVMEYKYGIALSYPPESLFTLIQNGFRKLEKKINKREDMAMIPCYGYISNEGKLIQPNGFSTHFSDNAVSGYFIFCVDKDRIKEVQKQMVDESDIILQLQFERAKYTQDRITDKRVKMGESIQKTAIETQLKLKPHISEIHTNHPITDWGQLFDAKASEEINQ